MVAASFQTQNIDSLWSIRQITIGSVACMCCVVFLGLKFKWFRAQFKVQDISKNKKSSETVQGIGFKVKSNPDDFQRYKVISEFASPINSNNIDENIKRSNDVNNSNVFNKVLPTSKQVTTNTLKSEEFNINSPVPNHVSKATNKNNVNVPKNLSSEIPSENITIEKNEKPLFEETEIKTSAEKNSKVSFVKNKSVQQRTEQAETVTLATDDTIVPQQYNSHINNQLAAHDIVMPQEDEDSWKIKIIDEKPKVQIDNRNDDMYYEEIHLGNHNSNTMISNSMYSSQAASIFFGSYEEKQPPDSSPPPIPIARKFLEDDDIISINSQTSA